MAALRPWVLRSAAPLALLSSTAWTIACGGAPDDGSAGCLSAKGDSDALADGAVDGSAESCGRVVSDGGPLTVVAITGGYGVKPLAPRRFHAELRLLYSGSSGIVPASFDETSPASPSIYIGYSALLDDGSTHFWECNNGVGTDPPEGTFQLRITSVESKGEFGADVSDTIHGTLHAVCPPSSLLAEGVMPGKGQVTIDGPF